MPIPNYETEIKPFDDSETAFTDDQIKDELNSQTFTAISVIDTRDLYDQLEWWSQEQAGNWVGELQAVLDDPSTPADIQQDLRKLWQWVYGVATRDMRTTLMLLPDGTARKTQGAKQQADLYTWLVQNVGDTFTKENWDLFYALGGGLKYPPGNRVTTADVAQSRTDWQNNNTLESERQRLRAINNSLLNQYIAPILESNDPAVLTDANLQQGYRDCADNYPAP